jgi:iron complex transport system substrate-binding protein
MWKCLLAAAASLLLGSCTNKQSAPSAVSSDVVLFKVGEKEYAIPAKPQRIVADYYVGELLKLEANLVGADLTYTSSAWDAELDQVVDVGQSLEAALALRPDLIITMHDRMVERYRAIAPTVLIPYGRYDPEELIRELAIITGTTEKASAWLAEFNQGINALAELIPDRNETYTIIDVWGGNAYLYGEHYGRGGYIIYKKLGLRGTPAGEEDYIRKADSYLNVAIESLPRYVGDVLLFMSSEDSGSANKLFMDTVIWNDLAAVRKGKVIHLDSKDFSFSDPFSLDLQVEILTRHFKGML